MMWLMLCGWFCVNVCLGVCLVMGCCGCVSVVLVNWVN